MPSGFQQDQNQLTPSYYRVTIDCGNESAYWYAEDDGNGAGTNEGRISAFTWDNFSGNDRPNTQSKADALARGYLRFLAIVEALSNLADCQILDIEHNMAPSDMHNNSWIHFTIKFDRDEGVFPALMAIKKAEGGPTNGTATVEYDNVTYPQYWAYGQEYTINNTQDALRDVIWNALAQTHTRSMRVFHPVESSDPLDGEGFQDVITAIKPFDNDGNAFNDIAVNEITDMTTTVSYDC